MKNNIPQHEGIFGTVVPWLLCLMAFKSLILLVTVLMQVMSGIRGGDETRY